MPIKTFSDFSHFQKRRQKLNELAPNAVFILFSGEEGHFSSFRAKSDFVYLTGFEEPSAVAVIRTGSQAQVSLFVRPKNPSLELWDGERFGPEKAQSEFAMDACFSNEDLVVKLPELINGVEKIYFALGDDPLNDELVLEARASVQQLNRRSGQPKLPIHDIKEVLAPMRMVKDEFEISLIKESCELSVKAHIEVMKNVKPGMNEKQALGFLLAGFYSEKASGEGYPSILASGANACTLHYRSNNRDMQEGDFLLIDAGAEKNYFTADITRTYPINGKFTEPQKRLYAAVLDVQKRLIDCVRVGFSLPEIHEKACEWLTEKMIELNLLKGTVTENLESKAYQKYYPHGTSHYLGMDVHDVGFAKIADKPVSFVPGVIITVEPGIYVPKDDESAPSEFRGLGVRIEDDILVGKDGPINLTALAPKEIEDLEKTILG